MQETLKNMNLQLINCSEFSAFAIKIVGQSYNTAVIPMVSNFRTLALAT